MQQDVAPDNGNSPLPLPNKPGLSPCLFDLRADPGEHWDLSQANPDVVKELYAALNGIILGQRDCSGWSGPIPGPYDPVRKGTGCSPPELMGVCNQASAAQRAGWGAPRGLFSTRVRSTGRLLRGGTL